jgi:6-pyruvoyl-tetrahydropterin synthase
MDESLSSVANRAKGKILVRILEEKKLGEEMSNVLQDLDNSIIADINENQTLLNEISVMGQSEVQEKTKEMLMELLVVNNRTKDTLHALKNRVTQQMEEKEADVLYVLGL